MQTLLSATSFEVDIFTGGVDLPFGSPLLITMVDNVIVIPPIIVTPTYTHFDGELVDTQSDKSVGQLDIRKELSFDCIGLVCKGCCCWIFIGYKHRRRVTLSPPKVSFCNEYPGYLRVFACQKLKN